MKKVTFIFGSIAGGIFGLMWLITLPYMMSGDMSGGETWGYAMMIIPMSLIFIGIKIYRDKYQSGSVKFSKAFLVGVYISLWASFLYALGWEISMLVHDVTPMEFMDYYGECQVKSMQENGASAAEIAERQKDIAGYGWYSNLLLRFPMSMAELFPVGLIISLISAAILRNKNVLPAKANN